jgi:hypothetical protein
MPGKILSTTFCTNTKNTNPEMWRVCEEENSLDPCGNFW